MSPDGKHIATGDFNGTIWVYDSESGEIVKEIQAHDQEVVCLDYSPFVSEVNKYTLASGSRDRMIHIFSSLDDYVDIKNLDDHTSSIVSIRFGYDPKEKEE